MGSKCRYRDLNQLKEGDVDHHTNLMNRFQVNDQRESVLARGPLTTTNISEHLNQQKPVVIILE